MTFAIDFLNFIGKLQTLCNVRNSNSWYVVTQHSLEKMQTARL